MKTKLYVQMLKWTGIFGESFELKISAEKKNTNKNYVVVDVCERIVDLNIPEIDPALLIAGEVDQIESAIAEEIAKSTAKIKAMQEQRASLLCLENKA